MAPFRAPGVKSIRTVLFWPVGVALSPVTEPGGWKGRMAFETGDHSLHFWDLLVARTSKVWLVLVTAISIRQLVAVPVQTLAPPDCRTS